MNKQEELIWRYLDGQLEAEDVARVEAALETDQAFKELFLQSQVLHQNLGAIEAEVPSLRFAQNVMDRLPLVKDLATGPLVSIKWLRTFYGGVIALLLALFGSSLALVPASSTPDPQVTRWVDTVRSVFDVVPANMLLMAGIILISLLVLLSLDRWLQNRFHRS
jgi:anti-sigma factor RsiW